MNCLNLLNSNKKLFSVISFCFAYLCILILSLLQFVIEWIKSSEDMPNGNSEMERLTQKQTFKGSTVLWGRQILTTIFFCSVVKDGDGSSVFKGGLKVLY